MPAACVCWQIGVIGLSDKPMYPRLDPCLPHTLVPATFETRIYFSKFIDSLEKQDSKCCVVSHVLHAVQKNKIKKMDVVLRVVLVGLAD